MNDREQTWLSGPATHGQPGIIRPVSGHGPGGTRRLLLQDGEQVLAAARDHGARLPPQPREPHRFQVVVSQRPALLELAPLLVLQYIVQVLQSATGAQPLHSQLSL